MNTAEILKINAYGEHWHVFVDGKGRVYSGPTRQSCWDYCRRHNLTLKV